MPLGDSLFAWLVLPRGQLVGVIVHVPVWEQGVGQHKAMCCCKVQQAHAVIRCLLWLYCVGPSDNPVTREHCSNLRPEVT